MTDLATLNFNSDSSSIVVTTKRLGELDAAATKAGSSADQLATSSKTTGSAMASMAADIEKAQRAQRDLAASAGGLSAAQLKLVQATFGQQAALDVATKGQATYQAAVIASAKAQREAEAVAKDVRIAQGALTASAALTTMQVQELTGVVRHSIDALAAGQSPMRVLATHAATMGQAFGGAPGGIKATTAALRALIVPFLPLIAAITTVVGLFVGGFMLATRAVNEQHKNLASTLGLTAKQLDKLNESGVKTTVTFGDTMKATFQVIGRDIAEALHLDKVAKAFGQGLDKLNEWSVTAVKAIVGVFTGAVEAILSTWRLLPGAMGDIIISGANVTIKGITSMLNAAIKLLTGKDGGLNAPQLLNPLAGQAGLAGQKVGAAFGKGFSAGANGVQKFLDDVGKQAVKNAQGRILKAAGKADKAAAATGADQTDRTAQEADRIAQMVAQANVEELNAQLGLNREIEGRAAIEKKIAAEQLASSQAQVQKEIDRITNAKDIDATAKPELIAKLEIVKLTQARTAGLKADLAEQDKRIALAKQTFDAEEAARQNATDILESQIGLAKYAFQRRDIERQLAKMAQDEAVAKQAFITKEHGYDAEAVDIAQKRIAALKKIYANENESAAEEELRKSYTDLSDALTGMASAIEAHDWQRAVSGLVDSITTAAHAFALAGSAADKATAIGGLLGSVGNSIGGQAGSAINGAGAGFSAFGAVANASGPLAGLAPLAGPIGIAVGIGSIISGLINGAAAAQKARRDAENQAAAAAVQAAQSAADAQRQLEISLLTASGDAVGALAATRAAELSKLNDTNAALQKQVYAWQDWNDAVANANTAITTAAQNLQTARDKMQGFADTLSTFRKGLDTSASSSLSPTAQYRVARAQFGSTADLAASGDMTALANLTGVSQSFLDVAKATDKTAAQYARDVAAVKIAVQRAQIYAAGQVSLADQQLGALATINDSVLTVAQAIQALAAAQGVLSGLNATKPATPDAIAAQTYKSTNGDYAAYVEGNPDLLALFRSNSGMAKGRTEAEFGAYQWANYGLPNGGENRAVRPYALGGAFTGPVGAMSDMLTRPTELNVGIGGEAGAEAIMPLRRGADGRLGVASDGGNNAALLAEVRAMRSEMAAMRSDSAQTARNTGSTAKNIDRAMGLGGGNGLATVAG